MDDDESTISSLGTLSEDHFYEDLNDDPMLSKEDAEAFMSPPQQAWIDANPKDAPTIVKIDTSTEQQWKLARMEIDHVKATMHRLIGVTYDKDQDKDGVVLKLCTILHLLGKTSKVATFFKENVSLSDTKYLQFMHTFCMQAAYNCSSRQLFYKCLKLQKALLLSETEYNGVWQWLANRKKLITRQSALVVDQSLCGHHYKLLSMKSYAQFQSRIAKDEFQWHLMMIR